MKKVLGKFFCTKPCVKSLTLDNALAPFYCTKRPKKVSELLPGRKRPEKRLFLKKLGENGGLSS